MKPVCTWDGPIDLDPISEQVMSMFTVVYRIKDSIFIYICKNSLL